jgi:hypothetical protein
MTAGALRRKDLSAAFDRFGILFRSGDRGRAAGDGGFFARGRRGRLRMHARRRLPQPAWPTGKTIASDDGTLSYFFWDRRFHGNLHFPLALLPTSG